MAKPLLAITLGDPAGVGPEVVAGAWPDAALHEVCRPLVVGQPEILRRAVKLRGISAEVQQIDTPADAVPSPRQIPCLAVGSAEALDIRPGSIDARGGQAAYDALVAAAHLALAGKIDAITTAPLHKVALHLAGHDYPGHTELLAELCGVDDFAMMLYLGHDERILGPAGLGVVHVTLHHALREVFERLSTSEIVAKAHLAADVMQRLKGSRPHIGVCALNPHAGEGGLFGGEEQSLIEPAVRAARADGLDIDGPLPADTLMVRAADGEFDGVVAMYHDQGHIALKLLGMHRAVNITLGLPIVRTSVAHGTAFDIAWQGRAEVSSMIEAVRVAALLARNRSSPA
jgi:4-hydroxythreonine-4-phosphate dehydrogenase